MTTLPDECDFCHSTLEEDEELEPVFIGQPPTPASFSVHHRAPKQEKVAAYQSQSDEIQQLGRPIDTATALLRSLDKSPHFEVEERRVVMELEVGDSPGALPAGRRRDDQVATELVVTPPQPEYEPDMMVCEYCAESLREE